MLQNLYRGIITVLLVVLTAGVISGCDKGENMGELNSRNTTETGSAGASRTIHSISELNTKEYPLDSSAGREKYSSLEANYRESYIMKSGELAGIKAYYPRIKKLQNGSFIMVFHNNYQGGSVYCTTSDDCISWRTPRVVFSQSTINIDGTAVELLYMTPDACVLPDGRIICITSYRAGTGYYYMNAIDQNGVSIKISEDNGKTWSEERKIYIGTNWEPSLLCDDNGEIYAMFSCTAPSIYEIGVENFYYRSSGIGLVRSSDGGKTWVPNVTGAPYIPQYVMRQYTGWSEKGINVYTDQMPVAVRLNNGTIALAAESQLKRDGYCYFSVSYSNDHFAQDIGMKATGPSDRQTNIFMAAGPYLTQFDSGEVLLTYHAYKSFRYRLGDSQAREFYDENIIIPQSGIWGSVEKTDSHSAALVIGTEDYRIQVVRAYLNHTINAVRMTPSLSCYTSEWNENTDALFCGSDSQAQAAVRVGHDDKNIYILAERLDKYITDADAMEFYLDSGKESFYKFTIGNEGISQMIYKKKAASSEKVEMIPSESGVKCHVYIDGTVNERKDMDNGIIYEISIPKALLGSNDSLRFLFNLINCDDAGEKIMIDYANSDTAVRNKEEWFRADFK